MGPLLIDMHFGAMLGVGLANGETSSQTTTSLSYGVLPGADRLPLVDTAVFSVGRLITYQDSSGVWWPAVVKANDGAAITISQPVESSAAAGATVAPFYLNFSHPNDYGYLTIADYALRNVGMRGLVARSSDPAGYWSAVGPAVLTGDWSLSYANPGCAAGGDQSILVRTTSPGQGAISKKESLVGGTYRANLVLRTASRDAGYNGTLTISVLETTASGAVMGIAQKTVTDWGGVRPIDLVFTARNGGAIQVQVLCANAAPARFNLGRLQYIRCVRGDADLDHGRHVLIGDSYFTNGTILARLAEKLPNAVFINAGIAGDSSADLVARFDVDVPPLEPDYVWVMVGTNDFYQGVSAELFATRINILRTRIAEIGAKAIFFNPSVGNAFYAPTGEKLTLSRSYAINTEYMDSV